MAVRGAWGYNRGPVCRPFAEALQTAFAALGPQRPRCSASTHSTRPMHTQPPPVPVITIDGPTASGKGTVAQRVARRFGFGYLDSGALYRLVALAALDRGVDLRDEDTLAGLAAHLDIRFIDAAILLDGREVGDALRAEAVGNAASAVAVFPAVRAALLARQRAARAAPGLVADGRDMGTVIFPDAGLKIFLTASVEARAERRSKQLMEKGFPVNIAALLHDLQERDARDAARTAAPLKPADDALVIDSSAMGIADVVQAIVDAAVARGFSLQS